jgi:GntR family transcriptional regulator
VNKDLWRVIRIDRRSATPLSDQIRNELQHWIASRQIDQETLLGPLSSLAHSLDVPVKDVQTAFDALCRLHYLIPVGVGTYKTTFIDLHSDLNKPFYVIIDQIAAMGLTVSIQSLERRVGTPTEEEARRFGFAATERILYLKRMYCGDQRAFFLGEHMIPLALFPMLEDMIQGNERIYPLMREFGKVEMRSSSRLAEAKTMSAALAEQFKVKQSSAYLEVSSQMFDEQHRHIESSIVCLIANYSIELSVGRESLF